MLGNRIKEARKKTGLNQEEFAEACGWDQGRQSHYETERREPGMDELRQIAKLAKVSLGALVDETYSMNQRDFAVEQAVSESSVGYPVDILGVVPLISWVQAGAWHEAIDNFHPGDAEDNLPCPVPHSKNTFAVQVSGESMADEYPEGFIIFVDPSVEPTHKSDVVIRLLPENDVTFKRYMLDGAKPYLRAMNKNWPNPIIPIEGDAEICGVVIFAGKYPQKNGG